VVFFSVLYEIKAGVFVQNDVSWKDIVIFQFIDRFRSCFRGKKQLAGKLLPE